MPHRAKFQKNKGFTLIELLVVISIISLLSTIVLASLNTARDKAQLAKFKEDLKSVRTALVLYRDNNNGAWPPSMDNIYGPLSDVTSELYNAGLLGSPTFTNPLLWSAMRPTIYPGELNLVEYGAKGGCTSDLSQVEYVVHFIFNDYDLHNQFLPFYYSSSNFSAPNILTGGCFEFY